MSVDSYIERRLAATASLKLSSASPTKHRSASPTTTAPLNSSHPRVASRLSRQSTTRQDTDAEEGDEDAEGEDADGDDEKLYCFCQKHSYGDVSTLGHCSVRLTQTFSVDDCMR